MNVINRAIRFARARRAIAPVAVVCSATLFAACSSLPAPRTYVPEADQVPQDVRGSWANVRVKDSGHHHVEYGGELIAVSADSLFLMMDPAGLQSFGKAHVDRVQVALFQSHESDVYGLGVLGGLSTLSSGWGFFLGFPVWLVLGASAGASYVDEAVTNYPSEVETYDALRPYARFPQGMPAAFHPAVAPRPAAITAMEGPIGPPPPRYFAPETAGNGLVLGVATIQDGKVAWSGGYHARLKNELFAIGGYTQFDRRQWDIAQWWAGLRIGEPYFLGAKYIYSTQYGASSNGAGVFVGLIVPQTNHVSVGAMVGYDHFGFDVPRTESLLWASFLVQVSPRETGASR